MTTVAHDLMLRILASFYLDVENCNWIFIFRVFVNIVSLYIATQIVYNYEVSLYTETHQYQRATNKRQLQSSPRLLTIIASQKAYNQ